MDPPPMPILCGFMMEVHSSAAMAPSTAEPPLFSMSLEELMVSVVRYGAARRRRGLCLATVTKVCSHMKAARINSGELFLIRFITFFKI